MDFTPQEAPDSIEWFRDRGETPTIVSISDIHGYLDAARNALTAVGETEEFDPVVTVDEDGKLHWAGNDYMLLVNGDLIDRGDQNRECIELVERLSSEAPQGRVRYHIGNHEMAVLFRDRFGWPGVFSVEMPYDERRSFIERVAAGDITAAFDGYNYTYSHAGDNERIDVAEVNEDVREVGEKLVEMMDEGRYDEQHINVSRRQVFQTGGRTGRGKSAGIFWMDFRHMEETAPAQVVGHSRHVKPTRVGEAICQNVIRENLNSPGGEAVVLETPEKTFSVTNTSQSPVVEEL